jgi:Spy/CpxP family protein refolding chaperone
MALAISGLLSSPPSWAQDEGAAVPEAGGATAEDAAPEEASAGEATPAEAPAAEEMTPEERAAQRRQQSIARAIRSIWWNGPAMVEALSLTDAVRAEMDELYRAYLEARAQSTAEREVRTAFVDALSKGDWGQARKRLDEVASENAAGLKDQGQLKIDVLSLLSDEQLAQLVGSNLDVLRRPWVPPGRRAGPGRPGPGRRPRPAGR